MLILWIRKSPAREQTFPNGSDIDTFQQHAEEMKRFRNSHPDIEASRIRDIMTPDGNILAPVQKVRLAECSQN